jgi:predicted DNA-binding ribbon-helix-helix protein
MTKRKGVSRPPWNKGLKTVPDPRGRRVSTRLTEATFAVLEQLAEIDDEKVSSLVRKAVVRYIASHPLCNPVERRIVRNARQQTTTSATLQPDDTPHPV